jgi:cytidylate kinase
VSSGARVRPIVAIDGPAGAGKSTVARALARRLGFVYVDTGALYRAVGLAAGRAGVATDDDAGLAALLPRLRLELRTDPAGATTVLLDGEDVSAAIRTPTASAAASAVSARAPVRAGLLDLQRRLAGGGGAVLEGRDIGTVVFPDAEVKVFLTASDAERARRRHAELAARGQEIPFAQVLEEQRRRDHDDASRALAPLRAAPDAVELVTDGLDAGAVVDRLAGLVAARTGAEVDARVEGRPDGRPDGGADGGA